MDEKIEPGRD